MIHKIAEERWFAVHVRSNFEQRVSDALAGRSLEAFYPSYLSPQNRKPTGRARQPLFPGYVFSRFHPLRRLPVLITEGVVRIVGFGSEPIPIPDEEIAALQAIDASTLLREPVSYIEAGDSVEVISGPLAGSAGIVVELSKRKRLVVSLTLLRRSVAVELDPAWLIHTSARPAVTTAGGHRHV